MAGIVSEVLVGLASLINSTLVGFNDIVLPGTNISLLTMILGGAVAIDVLVFYKRLTDNPTSIIDAGTDIYHDIHNRITRRGGRKMFESQGDYQHRMNHKDISKRPGMVNGHSVRPVGTMATSRAGPRKWYGYTDGKFGYKGTRHNSKGVHTEGFQKSRDSLNKEAHEKKRRGPL